MSAPVTSPVPAVRQAPARDRTDPVAGAGFAAALDGALARRAPVGSASAQARSDRRGPPDGLPDRAADHPDDRAARAADKADQRAADRAERAAERNTQAADRTAARADRATAKARTGDDSGADTDADTAETADAADAALSAGSAPAEAAARSGLTRAVWALLMGGPAPGPA